MARAEFLRIEERLLIESFIKEGLMAAEIAERLNRSKGCIHKEVRRNGGREKYEAHNAHNRHKNLTREGYFSIGEKLREKWKDSRENKDGFEERISSLEEQVKILSETLIGFMEANND